MWSKDEKNIIKQLLQELIPASEDYNIPSAGLDSVINYLENKVKEDLNFRKLFNDRKYTYKTTLRVIRRLGVFFFSSTSRPLNRIGQ